jgi:hypothetical protein
LLFNVGAEYITQLKEANLLAIYTLCVCPGPQLRQRWDVVLQSSVLITSSLFQVSVVGLPFSASFKYALYTHGYIRILAFPSVGAQPEHRSIAPLQRPASCGAAADTLREGCGRRSGSHLLAPSARAVRGSLEELRGNSLRAMDTVLGSFDDRSGAFSRDAPVATAYAVVQEPWTTMPAASRGGAVAESANEGSQDEAVRRVAFVLAKSMMGRAQVLTLRGLARHPSAVNAWLGSKGAVSGEEGDELSTCPASSSSLNVTDAEILGDSHMVTAFVNDAVPQCLLWALYRQNLLEYTVRDGDVPQVRSDVVPPDMNGYKSAGAVGVGE